MSNLSNRETFDKQAADLAKEVDNLGGKLPPANIIVAGIAGAGKSTLLNAVFGSDLAKTGVGRPVTPNITEYFIPGEPIRIWDTAGFELDSVKAIKSMKDIHETIAKKASQRDLFDRIHAIWYCINEGSGKVHYAESDFIKKLYSEEVPFIIVITQCIKDEGFDEVVREINKTCGLGDVDVIPVMAKDYKVGKLGIVESFGLDKLVDVTLKKLPEFIKSGFIAAQRVDVVQKRRVSEDIIVGYVTNAKNGFWDKVPLINIVTTTSAISEMFQKIGQMYNAVLPDESISTITRGCSVEWGDIWEGLLNPFDGEYRSRVAKLLEDMREKDGLNVSIHNFSKSESAAQMIAFCGYGFIIAVEEVWNESTEKQLKDVDYVVDRIRRYMSDYLKKAKKG